MKKITIADIFILAVFIAIISLLFFLNFIKNNNNSNYLFIDSPQGKYYYSINQKKTIEIKGETGITKILIDNGRFKFTDSSCANKDCIKMGWVNIKNFPVVCLPNKVSAYITGKNNDDNEADFDEVTQ